MHQNGDNTKLPKDLILFDLDGTLTIPRQLIQDDMKEVLKKLKAQREIGIVSGSDLPKINEQIGKELVEFFDYILPENGVVMYKQGKHVKSYSLQQIIGDDNLQKFINYVLKYLSNLWLPFKRGTFIEYRKGLINIAPAGRNSTQEERDAFSEYDKKHKIRDTMVKDLRKTFPDLGLTFSIGGQTSIDCFPKGWDKSFCLQHFPEYENIYFFGDKTMEGGNDYEIFEHERTISHTVTDPQDTIRKLNQIFGILSETEQGITNGHKN